MVSLFAIFWLSAISVGVFAATATVAQNLLRPTFDTVQPSFVRWIAVLLFISLVGIISTPIVFRVIPLLPENSTPGDGGVGFGLNVGFVILTSFIVPSIVGVIAALLLHTLLRFITLRRARSD